MQREDDSTCKNKKASTELHTLQTLQSIADQLRVELNTNRTTIRIDSEALGLALESVAVESLAHGVKAIKSTTTPGLRNGNAPRWLMSHRRTFVMDDCLNPAQPELAPEPYVIETYGVHAEMVSPVFKDQQLIGIISVHHTVGPRQWTPTEVAGIETACKRVANLLGEIDSAR